MIKKLFIFLVLQVVLVSCKSIIIYKPNTSSTSLYFIKSKSKYEEFTYNGKDTCSLQYKENQINGIENISTNPRKVWIFKDNEIIIYRYKNRQADTLYLNKNQYSLVKAINPFCITLPTTICNSVKVSNIHGNLYLLRYFGDSIHYFNNQHPIKTHVFQYIGLPNGTPKDTLDYKDPIFMEVSSDDGVIVGSLSTYSVPMAFELKELYYYSIIDFRKVITSRNRLRKFLM